MRQFQLKLLLKMHTWNRGDDVIGIKVENVSYAIKTDTWIKLLTPSVVVINQKQPNQLKSLDLDQQIKKIQ